MTTVVGRQLAEDTPQDRYTSSYTRLSRQVKDLGLLRRRYGYYWVKMSLTGLALAGVVAGMVLLGDSWLQLILAGALAVVFVQFALLGHDAAHRQIFRSGQMNVWASMVFGPLFAGISTGWWQHKHSSHHANPNKLGRDPDIDSNAVAFTPYALAERRGLGKFLAERQAWFYLPMLMLEGLDLHVSSVRRVLDPTPLKRRGWEIAFLAIRHGAFLAGPFLIMSPGKAVAFIGLELALYGFYLGGSFTPNHVGMAIVPPHLKIDFLRRQVLMSRNVSGGWFIHFLLGGLNFQIEHHLFPSMPRPNLRRLQPLVRRACLDNDITYTERSLPRAFRDVLRYLNDLDGVAVDPFGCPIAAQLRAPGLARSTK